MSQYAHSSHSSTLKMTVLSTMQSSAGDYLAKLVEVVGDDNWKLAMDNKWSIAAGTMVVYAAYKYLTRPKNLPPGPRGVPLFGAMFSFSSQRPMHFDVIKFCEHYKSDIISYYMGKQLIVMLNSADAVKQCYVKSDEFNYRDQGALDDFGIHEQFFAVQYSEEWSKLKTATMSSLKTHGFGTKRSEENMKEQLDMMMERLHTLEGNTIDSQELKHLFAKAGAGVIMKILVNHTYDFDDPELDDVIKRVSDFVGKFFENFFLIFFYKNILPAFIMWFVKRTFVSRTKASVQDVREVFYPFLEEHENSLDLDNSRDFMDDLLIRKANGLLRMTDLQIIDSFVILSPDAIDTQSTLASWVLFYVCWHPEVQDEMLKEIRKVCGDNTPTMKDRNSLAYCEAVLLESQRMSTIATRTVAHLNMGDTNLNGYFIPKKTHVLANLYGVHYDKRVFPEPKKFKPNRFISNGKFANFENVMAFGVGRRKCVGEPLIKSEIFFYITSIIQKFELSFVEKPSSMETDNVYRTCPANKMKFVPRY